MNSASLRGRYGNQKLWDRCGSNQIERAGFELKLPHDNAIAQAQVKVNIDWFIQTMINMIDKAVKFSAKADKKVIEISCQRLSNGQIQFKVRDFGSGIAKDQMKKIFKLFYRSENELTHETARHRYRFSVNPADGCGHEWED